MTMNQFQYSKEEFIVISKQKQQTFKLNYSLIKYILCVFHLFMHVNNFSDDEMQLAITINQKHSHSGTWNITREHINVGFRSREGGGVFHTDTLYKLFIKLQLPLLATIECFCSKWFCSLRKYHRSRCLSVRIRHFRLTREINQLRQEIPVVKRCF